MEIREINISQMAVEMPANAAIEKEVPNSVYDELDTLQNEVQQCSDIEELNELYSQNNDKGIIDNLIDGLKGFFKPKCPDTKDGAIDATKQSQNGDCWILSGVNSLSYSEAGKEIIKNAFEYNEDSTTVHLKGIGDYSITNDELKAAKKDKKYAKGDDDMVILELAMEKVLNEFKDKQVDFKNFNESKNMKFVEGLCVTYGGLNENAIYFITGKESQKITDKDEMTKTLDELSNNHADKALATSIGLRDDKTVTVKDSEGKEVSLSSRHAYAIKNIDDDTVSVVNPWDSSKTLKFSKEVFVETFDDIVTCDFK